MSSTPVIPSGASSSHAASFTRGGGIHTLILGGFYILLGTLIGFFWLWGNAVQIQTSEAWIIGIHSGLTLSPRLDIFLQLGQIWSGNLTLGQGIAYTWGWLNQIILLVFSIGIEKSILEHRQVTWLKWMCLLFIVLNSLADLNYGNAFGEGWQPWAFAGICFMASFFFGLVAIGLIAHGVKLILHG